MVHAWGIWLKQELRFMRMSDLLPGDYGAMMAFFTKDEAEDVMMKISNDALANACDMIVMPLER